MFRTFITVTVLSFFCFAQSPISTKGSLEVKVADTWKDAQSIGFVNLAQLDTSIRIDLKYSTKDNFLHEVLYEHFDECFLQKKAAEKLCKAQHILDSLKPGYALIVYDALRPRSAQFRMWKIVEGTPKQMYVGNPRSGSIHNYGAAVDVSIVDSSGNLLDMGTPFDFFGKEAQPRHEAEFLKNGTLTQNHIKNRELLRTVMKMAGYFGISVEWWHYNAFPKKHIRSTYPVIEDIRYRETEKQ